MKNNLVKKLCIYCNNPVVKVGKGEHIIPRIIWGGRTIKTVCQKCNNSFSVIDKELCSRSMLSLVASQEINAHIWQIWDVDHEEKNLLLEANPVWTENKLTTLKLYPQVVFDPAALQIRSDYEEMLCFGRDSFQKVFEKALLIEFRRYNAGENNGLHFERIELNPKFLHGYRYPPRVFSRNGIREIARRLSAKEKVSFVVRYRTRSELWSVLNTLDNWTAPFSKSSRNRCEVGIGSRLPTLRCSCDGEKVLRAWAKIAINVMSDYCPNTPVRCTEAGFAEIIQLIKGEVPVPPNFFRSNGFTYAFDIQPIKSSNRGHSFRLLHMDGHWHIYSSFFGGRIGSFLRFRGPNGEQWQQLDIEAPLRTQKWNAIPGRILQPLTVRVEWNNPSKVIPSARVLNFKSWSTM